MTPAVALACALAVAVTAAMALAAAWARAVALAAAAAWAVAVRLGVVVGALALVTPAVCPFCVVCVSLPGLLLACPRGMNMAAREPATMSRASKMIITENQSRR